MPLSCFSLQPGLRPGVQRRVGGGATPPPLHGRARLTKAIKRTLLTILEQAAAAHYLAAQLISKAVRNAQQSSKWNSLIWYFPIMLPYSVVMTGGRWNIFPLMETHLIPLSPSCLIWELPAHRGHPPPRKKSVFSAARCVCMLLRLCPCVHFFRAPREASPRRRGNRTRLSALKNFNLLSLSLRSAPGLFCLV